MFELKDKKITVMGIGLHGGGVGTIKFLVAQGAQVCATDLRDEKILAPALKELNGLPVRFVLGRHEKEDFTAVDLIIKNPGVPTNSVLLSMAKKNGIKIMSDVGLFVERNPAFVVGVTGTKGKSTISSLIAHILKATGIDVFLAGNIRTSVLEVLPKIKKYGIVVLELSSWQLEDLADQKWSPAVAVFSNLLPDHLNRYDSMDEYGRAKKIIFKFQHKEDFLVANMQDEYVKQAASEASGHIIFFTEIMTDLPNLPGKHNACNIAAALGAIEGIVNHPDSPIKKIDPKIIKSALKTFKLPEGRLEEITTIKGIRYINDTAATTPEAVCAAINSFKKENTILIAGGENKGLKYINLAKEIAGGIKFLILLDGSASEELKKEFVKNGYRNFIDGFKNMKEAVDEAKKHAASGDTILLSPGAASFNLFIHEFDRGEKFKKAI